MKTIDWEHFWSRRPLTRINNTVVVNCEHVVNYILGRRYRTGQSRNDKCLRQVAYILATIDHETAYTFRPIKEMGSQAYLRSKPYFPFYGRGFVQLTWRANYIDMGERIHRNQNYYTANPDILLTVPESTAVIDVWFYEKHITRFNRSTGNGSWDLKDLRRIVNITDRWQQIGNLATKIYRAMRWSDDNIVYELQSPMMYSERLKVIQHKLTDAGVYNFTITGLFGVRTAQAIRDYQKANGLEVTGKIDTELLKLLT